MVKLFDDVLWSTYFTHNGMFYEQIDRLVMGSPLSLVIADFFMEVFEKAALDTAPQKMMVYKRYIDDTLLIWPHGHEAEFVMFLNNHHDKIRFIVKIEQGGKLPFLDMLIIKHQGGSLDELSIGNQPT